MEGCISLCDMYKTYTGDAVIFLAVSYKIIKMQSLLDKLCKVYYTKNAKRA